MADTYQAELDAILSSESMIQDEDSHKYSYMTDEHETITIQEKKVNIGDIGKILKGESNSTMLTFAIDRFYDGVDLYGKSITIICERLGLLKKEGFTEDVTNIEYSSSTLKFSWVLSEKVTYKAGIISAAVQFTGRDETGKIYALKTSPFALMVEDTLDGTDMDITVSDDWFTSIESRLNTLENASGLGDSQIITDYTQLNNIPTINGVKVTSAKSLDDYGIAAKNHSHAYTTENQATTIAKKVADEKLVGYVYVEENDDEEEELVDLDVAVATSVNAYLGEKGIATTEYVEEELNGYNRIENIYNGSYKVYGNATTAEFVVALDANCTYNVILTCDADVLSTDSTYAMGATYKHSGFQKGLLKMNLGVEKKFTPTEPTVNFKIWLPTNNAGYLYLSVTKEETKLGISQRVEQVENSIKKINGSFSIIGDSYSTFKNWITSGNSPWYPRAGNDVTSVKETWWYQLSKETGLKLLTNESYSGSTVCNTGYDGADSTTTSFITRAKKIGEDNIFGEKPNVIFIFGGLNDSWAGVPIGEVKYDTFEMSELNNFLPAYSYLVDYLQLYNPQARIISVYSDGIKTEMKSGIQEIVEHYGIESVAVSGYTTQSEHADISGMKTICSQIKAIL